MIVIIEKDPSLFQKSFWALFSAFYNVLPQDVRTASGYPFPCPIFEKVRPGAG